jgi:hypothetical protein
LRQFSSPLRRAPDRIDKPDCNLKSIPPGILPGGIGLDIHRSLQLSAKSLTSPQSIPSTVVIIGRERSIRRKGGWGI